MIKGTVAPDFVDSFLASIYRSGLEKGTSTVLFYFYATPLLQFSHFKVLKGFRTKHLGDFLIYINIIGETIKNFKDFFCLSVSNIIL